MRKVLAIAFVLIAASPSLLAAQQQIVEVTANPELCEPLLEAADEQARNERAMGKEASESVSGGEGDLEDESCFGDLNAFNNDFFSGVPSLNAAALKALKDKALEAINDAVCDVGKGVTDALNTLTDCSASIGLSLSGKGFELPSVEACGGRDFDYEFGEDLGGGDGKSYNANVDADTGLTNKGMDKTKKGNAGGYF